MFKAVFEKHPEAMAKFFAGIGYTSTSQTKYEFIKPIPAEEGKEVPSEDVNPYVGNIEVLEVVAKIIETETQRVTSA